MVVGAHVPQAPKVELMVADAATADTPTCHSAGDDDTDRARLPKDARSGVGLVATPTTRTSAGVRVLASLPSPCSDGALATALSSFVALWSLTTRALFCVCPPGPLPSSPTEHSQEELVVAPTPDAQARAAAKLVGELVDQHAKEDSDSPDTTIVRVACLSLATARRSFMLWRVAANLATTLAEPPPQAATDLGTVGRPDSEWDVLVGNFADVRGRLAMADAQATLTKVETQALTFHSARCEVEGEGTTTSDVEETFPSLFDVRDDPDVALGPVNRVQHAHAVACFL